MFSIFLLVTLFDSFCFLFLSFIRLFGSCFVRSYICHKTIIHLMCKPIQYTHMVARIKDFLSLCHTVSVSSDNPKCIISTCHYSFTYKCSPTHGNELFFFFVCLCYCYYASHKYTQTRTMRVRDMGSDTKQHFYDEIFFLHSI